MSDDFQLCAVADMVSKHVFIHLAYHHWRKIPSLQALQQVRNDNERTAKSDGLFHEQDA
jgi:hypothetical protein